MGFKRLSQQGISCSTVISEKAAVDWLINRPQVHDRVSRNRSMYRHSDLVECGPWPKLLFSFIATIYIYIYIYISVSERFSTLSYT